MSKNLFSMVMEADDETLQPFDDSAAAVEDTAPAEEAPPSAPEEMGTDDPPPEPVEGGGTLSAFDDTDAGEPNYDDNGADPDDDQTEPNAGDTKLSEKANNILNQKLYQQMVHRNSEVEEIVENIQTLAPLIPYEFVVDNDKSLNRLKSALETGQQYVINRFLDQKYGENQLFFRKLDTLYTVLLDEIDKNLKKIKK